MKYFLLIPWRPRERLILSWGLQVLIWLPI